MASAAAKFTPLLDRVLVEKLVPPAKSLGGILLPESKQKINAGKVIAVGKGMWNSDGELVANSVKEGDKVLLPDWGGIDIKLEDKEYLIYRDEQLLGVLHD